MFFLLPANRKGVVPPYIFLNMFLTFPNGWVSLIQRHGQNSFPSWAFPHGREKNHVNFLVLYLPTSKSKACLFT